MFDVRLPLFDYALNDLVCHHHVSDSEPHGSNHALPSIDVSLDLEPERKWLLVEVQPQIGIVGKITHDRLEGVRTI